MRPAGDIRHALLKAARDLQSQGHRPTLRELAHHAQVGVSAATVTVKNLRRAGLLAVAGQRRVEYRNRPVAEYAPAEQAAAAAFVDLAAVFRTWSH